MKFRIYFFIVPLLIYSCSTVDTNNASKTEIIVDSVKLELPEIMHEQEDSLIIWVNIKFDSLIKEDISICDCWRETKYHFLYYDTTEMELYLKSNLMHYGHDSDLIFPLKQTGNVLKYDSTMNNWPEESKEFEIPTNDTLTLLDGNQSYMFIKRIFTYQKDTTQKYFFIHSKLRDVFYILNSHLLLKYDMLDTLKSTHELIDLRTLHKLIINQKVTAHCSDDYYLDGITIKGDKNRYFQLEFDQKEVSLFEYSDRNRYEKLNLDTLPKQVLRIK